MVKTARSARGRLLFAPGRSKPRFAASALAVVALAGAISLGCDGRGTIGDPLTAGGGDHVGAGGGGGAAGAAGASMGEASSLLPARIRRITNAEFDNSVQALLGIASTYGQGFTPDARQDSFTTNDAQRADSVFAMQ